MKTDINGCSTCPAGCEQIESFQSNGKTYYQYDYRTADGRLYTTAAPSIEIARKRCEAWLKKESAVQGAVV